MAEKLLQAKSQLEKLELTQAWSLRETDLYDFYKLVARIDESRRDGKFLDSEGNTPEEGQTVRHQLLLPLVGNCGSNISNLCPGFAIYGQTMLRAYIQPRQLERGKLLCHDYGIFL